MGSGVSVSVAVPPDTDTPGFELENKGKVRPERVALRGAWGVLDGYSISACRRVQLSARAPARARIQGPSHRGLAPWPMSRRRAHPGHCGRPHATPSACPCAPWLCPQPVETKEISEAGATLFKPEKVLWTRRSAAPLCALGAGLRSSCPRLHTRRGRRRLRVHDHMYLPANAVIRAM